MPKPRRSFGVVFEPVAGLALRDARPFQAGVSSVAHALPFPPPPGPFWSAARDALKGILRKGDHFESRGLCLRKDGERFFPCPLDLLTRIDAAGDAVGWTVMTPVQNPGSVAMDAARASYPDPRRPQEEWHQGRVFAWNGEERVVPADESFMSAHHWRSYLTGAAPDVRFDMKRADDFHRQDVRVGTELEGRSARPGRLYSEPLTFLREGTCFEMGVELESDEPRRVPDTALTRLGGEAKIAALTFTQTAQWNAGFDNDARKAVRRAILKDGTGSQPLRLKLCLLTPAIYAANINALRQYPVTPAWRPTWLRDVWTLADRIPTPRSAPATAGSQSVRYEIRLVAALTGKAYPLGFWDSRPDRDPESCGNSSGLVDDDDTGDPGRGCTKPLYRCLPAGAVYFLELRTVGNAPHEQALDDFLDRFWFRSLLLRKDGVLTFFGKMGFGVAVAGGWNDAQ